jgi:hypothetical protein
LIKASHQHLGAQNKETMMTFTDDQLKKLSIFPHFTAMLSICGSLLIIFEVLTDFRKRGKVSAKSYNTLYSLRLPPYQYICANLFFTKSYITG